MMTSEGQLGVNNLEMKLERQGYDGLDMRRGGIVAMLDKVKYGSARQEEKWTTDDSSWMK